MPVDDWGLAGRRPPDPIRPGGAGPPEDARRGESALDQPDEQRGEERGERHHAGQRRPRREPDEPPRAGRHRHSQRRPPGQQQAQGREHGQGEHRRIQPCGAHPHAGQRHDPATGDGNRTGDGRHEQDEATEAPAGDPPRAGGRDPACAQPPIGNPTCSSASTKQSRHSRGRSRGPRRRQAGAHHVDACSGPFRAQQQQHEQRQRRRGHEAEMACAARDQCRDHAITSPASHASGPRAATSFARRKHAYAVMTVSAMTPG
ncbi:MAG: hypothetical protein MZV63_16755 [Marinilabiliales bacterium]|nr:hypothetical protein [Marinilabiliales bacterium]